MKCPGPKEYISRVGEARPCTETAQPWGPKLQGVGSSVPVTHNRASGNSFSQAQSGKISTVIGRGGSNEEEAGPHGRCADPHTPPCPLYPGGTGPIAHGDVHRPVGAQAQDRQEARPGVTATLLCTGLPCVPPAKAAPTPRPASRSVQWANWL